MAEVSDYLALVTPQHADKSKFMATLGLVAGCFVNQFNATSDMVKAFDLDQASGVQLDAVGLWAGLSRAIRVPIGNVYFAWDTLGVGWDQGVWKRASDPATGITLLDDHSYRLLIRAKIGANHWDGSNEDSVAILNGIFAPEGLTPTLTDNQDMTMTISLAGGQLSALSKALIDGGYIPVRPCGVLVNYEYNIYTLLLDGSFALDGSETLDGYR
ncbi:hypothetical protein FHW84_001841 [Dyella sp. SG562]|uniref:DUF2612 domain-containing protein n=1 Tax=Dyella sp. SG562 TaxID=2587017 RepID=UPI001422CB9A|nr:DUF2612 domain-containing protein [Dyella sp. SG562]NII73272.1 hypothetical protein [Dyella sp. SG562]